MAINVAVSIVVWATAAVLIVSILATGGLTLPSSVSFLDKHGRYSSGETVHGKTYFEIFGTAFVLRIVMLFFAAAAVCLFMDTQTLSWSDFLDKFVIWDANSYVNIAKGGYTEYLENGEPITLVFFPFYSLLIRILSYIIPDVRLAGLVVSALCFAVGCCFMYAFVTKSLGSDVAKKSVLYLSVSPFGFFFGTLMSESAFFMMICICLYLIREEKYLLFGLAGILCALARMQGVLIIIPACIHWFEKCRPVLSIRKKRWAELWHNVYARLLFVFLPVIGTLIYFYENYRIAGDAFAFLDYQRRYWQHGYQYIGEALGTDVNNAFSNGLSLTAVSIWIPQLFFFLLALGLCIYGVKRYENHLTAYLLAYTVVSYSLDWLISGSRYMLTAVPVWIFLGELGSRYRRLDRFIRIVSPILMGVYFTGYLFMKQIM